MSNAFACKDQELQPTQNSINTQFKNPLSNISGTRADGASRSAYATADTLLQNGETIKRKLKIAERVCEHQLHLREHVDTVAEDRRPLDRHLTTKQDEIICSHVNRGRSIDSTTC